MWASQASDGGNISCECQDLVSTSEAGMTSRSMPSRQMPLKTFCLMAHVCCDVFSTMGNPFALNPVKGCLL